MLTNAPLRLKLLLILLFPLLGFIALTAVYIGDNYRTLRDMQDTVVTSSNAQSLSQLITLLQRERGASGVFIGSRGATMGNRLAQMRSESDVAIDVVRRLPTADDADIANVHNTLETLATLREQVDKLAIDSTASGARYTEIIKTLVGYTHSLENRVSNTGVVHALNALNQFIELKERAGRERVLLGLAFNQGHFDAALLSRFSRNLGEFTAYAESFQRKAPAAVLSQYQQSQQTPAAIEVGKLQRLGFERPLGEALGVKPEAWFEIATQRIDQMGEVEQALAQSVARLAKDARGEASQALWLTIAGALLALAMVALLSWLIIGSIGMAVKDINAALDGLARRDLTARTGYRSKDEFGQIAENLNRMANELTDIVQEIGNATAQVATAAEESSAVTLQTSRSVEQQRQSTELVATAINQMSATVREVAQSTTDAASLSQQIHASTTQGRIEVDGTIDLIRELSSQAEQTAAIIDDLKQESDAISSVLDVIRGIADQTNLLALNAAIEAARAGDHGRGFAVVASEVRTLAQRTQESTGNIQQMISNLQAGSDRASSSMLETLGKAQSGASRVGRAGELLASITEGVARISDRNIQIASAAEEQSSVSEDINRNVNEINDLVIQVSAGAQQTAVTSQELARLAEHQQNLVSRFRTA
ncbi:methyl-accepting chemotaxis protein [Pseudomonas mosselii]|uniref:Methyl-accepting chemotaxis protein n=2 Tax=Pseudomonas TaxID=286 RepID=A0A5R8ZHM9_9PSED|nr:methyl-accepting chemotaxis protein [Pseudomonas mosselii]TLP65270.1 methyl-accepting chemotaxis protein [Pseudomonas mosselii]